MYRWSLMSVFSEFIVRLHKACSRRSVRFERTALQAIRDSLRINLCAFIFKETLRTGDTEEITSAACLLCNNATMTPIKRSYVTIADRIRCNLELGSRRCASNRNKCPRRSSADHQVHRFCVILQFDIDTASGMRPRERSVILHAQFR